MDAETLEGRVRSIISKHLKIGADDVVPEASLAEDLGADSLDIIELLMTFEEEFDLSIPDDDVLHVRTVGDINESLTPLVQDLVTPTD